ncbi:MAG: type II CAAX prenyl endopeptidase Rce1 family protein [Promethearchaeota archaeon]
MLKNVIKEHPLTSYFIIASMSTWILLMPLVLTGLGILSVNIIWHALGAFGPTIAAILVTYISQGKDGLVKLKERCFKWRVKWIWVIIVIFGPFALFGLGILINFLFTRIWFDFYAFIVENGLVTVGAVLAWVWVNAFAYGIFEEIGWRGFALPRLQQKYIAIRATTILWIFWGLWHIPMFFYKLPLAMAPLWALGMYIGAIIMTFIFNSTQGSVLMGIFFHITNNIVMVFDVFMIATIISIEMSLLAILIVWKWGPEKLSTGEKIILEVKNKMVV